MYTVSVPPAISAQSGFQVIFPSAVTLRVFIGSGLTDTRLKVRVPRISSSVAVAVPA